MKHGRIRLIPTHDLEPGTIPIAYWLHTDYILGIDLGRIAGLDIQRTDGWSMWRVDKWVYWRMDGRKVRRTDGRIEIHQEK